MVQTFSSRALAEKVFGEQRVAGILVDPNDEEVKSYHGFNCFALSHIQRERTQWLAARRRIEVVVYRLSGEEMVFHMSLRATIADVKMKISHVLKVELVKQKLLHSLHLLSDDMMIRSLGKGQDTLRLTFTIKADCDVEADFCNELVGSSVDSRMNINRAEAQVFKLMKRYQSM